MQISASWPNKCGGEISIWKRKLDKYIINTQSDLKTLYKYMARHTTLHSSTIPGFCSVLMVSNWNKKIDTSTSWETIHWWIVGNQEWNGDGYMSRLDKDIYFAAATIADRACVKVEMIDPSCNLSLHPKLNLYLQIVNTIQSMRLKPLLYTAI